MKIYAGESRGYNLFTLVFYEAGERKRRTFADLNKAKSEAEIIATRLENNQHDVFKLSNTDQQTFAVASRELSVTGTPLLDAVKQYVAASQALPAGVSLLAAAKDYAQRHAENIPQKAVAEVIAEFYAAKKQDGASEVYLRTLRYHLNPLGERFKTAIGNVTTRDLDTWLRSLGHSPRTRKNAAVSLTTLFRFARGLGYLPKNIPTEAEGVAQPKVSIGKIGIITPKELATILHAADTDDRRIYFALGAFTGIRATELSKLTWKNIDLAGRHIEISADNAKTATRRLVPICDALLAWLLPYSERTGKVFTSQRAAERLVEWAKTIIGKWPKNALRHTFVSCRVAQTQNVSQTALEAGNSPAMIYSNYRELVTPALAEKWFSILPVSRVKLAAKGV